MLRKLIKISLPIKIVKYIIVVLFFSELNAQFKDCLLYTSPSPRDATLSRMPSSA